MSDDMNESPHITALRRQRQLGGKPKFRITGGKVEVYVPRCPLQDIEATVAAARAAEERAYAEMVDATEIGQPLEARGIYIGTWAPVNREGKSLGKIFNVFAAPENLPGEMTYFETLNHMAQLEGWHGHNGTGYEHDVDIYAALEDESYGGGWIIPPRELLIGTEADALVDARKTEITQPDNLFDHKDAGVLSGSFSPAAERNGIVRSPYYWSSSMKDPALPVNMWFAYFSDGTAGWVPKDNARFMCRPVRLELKS